MEAHKKVGIIFQKWQQSHEIQVKLIIIKLIFKSILIKLATIIN